MPGGVGGECLMKGNNDYKVASIFAAFGSTRLSSMYCLVIAFAIQFMGPFQAIAAPLTWTLQGVTFNDGGSATGDITFDASSGSVLNWDISISGGDVSTFPAFTYTPATVQEVGIFAAGPGMSLQFFVDPSAPGGIPESRLLSLTTDGLLTDSGGAVSLITQANTPDGFFESAECYNCTPYRLIVGGSLNAVPVPAAIWLFGSGLLGLVGISRRKKMA
jgi:hypothetical protein